MLSRIRRAYTLRRTFFLGKGSGRRDRVLSPAVDDRIGTLPDGSWEPEITRLLAGATRPGTTILDVGANIGASAIPLLAAFPDIHALSFEPSPSVLRFLTRTHEESRFRDRWEVIPKAVTEQSGADVTFTTFDCPGADVFDGLRDTGRTGALARQVAVPTTSVDAEWQSRGRPPVSVLKVDVEGAELGVLAGAALRGRVPARRAHRMVSE